MTELNGNGQSITGAVLSNITLVSLVVSLSENVRICAPSAYCVVSMRAHMRLPSLCGISKIKSQAMAVLGVLPPSPVALSQPSPMAMLSTFSVFVVVSNNI
ncbi:MAG TPA: hypothetical protein PLT66_03760 [Bacillota bacterium]|nr:hypothetical protein [Bacillota bacterium]